jgi:hypothetical protein
VCHPGCICLQKYRNMLIKDFESWFT